MGTETGESDEPFDPEARIAAERLDDIGSGCSRAVPFDGAVREIGLEDEFNP